MLEGSIGAKQKCLTEDVSVSLCRCNGQWLCCVLLNTSLLSIEFSQMYTFAWLKHLIMLKLLFI